MREVIFVVEPDPKNGWIARSLSDSIVATAETMEELRTNIREAVNWRYVRESAPVIVKLKIADNTVFPT